MEMMTDHKEPASLWTLQILYIMKSGSGTSCSHALQSQFSLHELCTVAVKMFGLIHPYQNELL